MPIFIKVKTIPSINCAAGEWWYRPCLQGVPLPHPSVKEERKKETNTFPIKGVRLSSHSIYFPVRMDWETELP